MDRFDEYYFTIAKETGGIEGLLNCFFQFLQRRTDFYYESDPGDKMGFPPGVAQKMVVSMFQKYQMEHYKKHPQKSPQEYQQKLLKQKESDQLLKLQEQINVDPNATTQTLIANQPQQKPKIQADVGFNTYNGGKNEKYQWSQSGNDVTVCVDLPEGTTKKDIIVSYTNTDLSVKLKKDNVVLVEGKLYDRIKQDDSMWSIEDNKKLILTLEKGVENIWKTVIQGDQEIDATKVENSKPLEDFDDETQGALRKIMYEQQRKQMGLPTTEEEKQLDALKKAWDAEGSPFQGQPFDPSKFNLSQQQNQFNM